MAVVVGFSSRKNEIDSVVSQVRASIATYSNSEWEINTFYTLQQFAEYASKNSVYDIACIDVANQTAVSIAELVRKNNKDAVILIIADTTVSPAVYMKPSIMAASLILIPFDKQIMAQTVNDLLKYAINDSAEESSDEESYVIKSKSEHQYVEHSKILYFEAREKKLFLNTQQREYGFYDNMDNLLDELPDYFIRCHRSFVINSHKIKKIRLSDGIIELENGIVVPLSKSYKPALKELKKNG